jgi:hypothetical protein
MSANKQLQRTVTRRRWIRGRAPLNCGVSRHETRIVAIMPPRKKQLVKRDLDAVDNIANAILAFIGQIPTTSERKRKTPELVAKARANNAATKAALAAGTLALPPGPVGWLTILPEMLAVWKIQAQMVSDIAAVYGKKSRLTQEQML